MADKEGQHTFVKVWLRESVGASTVTAYSMTDSTTSDCIRLWDADGGLMAEVPNSNIAIIEYLIVDVDTQQELDHPMLPTKDDE